VTASLWIALILGSSPLCAHLTRATVLLTLSYLALRHSEPDKRSEILRALVPALHGTTSPRSRRGGCRPSEQVPAP
jgi:hypothetical protein